MIENINDKISYALFCRLRPFWIVHPTESDRATCQCKIHENCQFILEKLYNLSYIETATVDKFVDSFACDSTNKLCIYSKCENCRDVKLKVACREHMQISDIENCKVCSSGSLKLLKPFDPHEIV